MKTIFLNMKTNFGTETVDEFTQEEGQTYKDFRLYVNQMVKEYHLTNQNVYKSSRCTNDWKNK